MYTWKIQVIANYPLIPKRGKKPKCESGTLHIKWTIDELELELRGIFYSAQRKNKKIWVRMPDKRGEIEGERCDFPIVALTNKEERNYFNKILKKAFKEFMKTSKFTTSASSEKKERKKRALKGMVFKTLSTPRLKR